jgi:hypothetical protein
MHDGFYSVGDFVRSRSSADDCFGGSFRKSENTLVE